MIKVKVVNKSKNELPEYSHPGDSGMDVRANLEQAIAIQPLERVLIPTGLYFELPEGYEIQVRPRSGLALKKGLTVLNTPGTVDETYRGEVGVILINFSNEIQVIEPSERIAQLVFKPTVKAELESIEEITDHTEREDEAYGGSGRF